MGMWALPAYGDFLEQLNPGTRERARELGGPERFEEVVAAVTVIPDDQPDTPAALGRHVRGRRRRRDRRAGGGARWDGGGAAVRRAVDPRERHPRPPGRDVQREPVRAREPGHGRPGGRRRQGVMSARSAVVGQPLDDGVERQAAAGVEQVEGLEARQDPEDVVRLVGPDAGAEDALLVELARDPRHRGGALLLPAVDRAADGLRVQLRHRMQGPVAVAARRQHLARGADAAPQGLAGIVVVRGRDEPVVATSLPQLDPDGVEEARARAEDRVDGRAGDAGHRRDPLHRDRLGGRVAQALQGGVDDPLARLLGLFGAGALFVAAGGHEPTVAIRLDKPSDGMLHFARRAVRRKNSR